MKVKDVISAIGSDKVPVRIFHRDGRITKGLWFQDYILKYTDQDVHYFSSSNKSLNIYLK